jgi:hypothetical protein
MLNPAFFIQPIKKGVNTRGPTHPTCQRGRLSHRRDPLSALPDRIQARFSGPIDSKSAWTHEGVKNI